MLRFPALYLVLFAFPFHHPFACFGQEAANTPPYDLVVYGGTSGGVMAAVQAKHMGSLCSDRLLDVHLGGLSSGGLGWT